MVAVSGGMRAALPGAAPPPNMQGHPVAEVFLITWAFEYLIEGASGFGTPVRRARAAPPECPTMPPHLPGLTPSSDRAPFPLPQTAFWVRPPRALTTSAVRLRSRWRRP